MSDRKQLVAVILLVAAFVAGYAVCRRPLGGPPIGSERPPGTEVVTKEPGDWSPKLIGDSRLREAVEQLIAEWEKLQAVNVTLKTKMPEAAGMEGETEGVGSYSMQRSEGVRRTRFRIYNTFTIPQEEEAAKLVTGEEILQIFDGEHLWLYLNQPQNQTVTKAAYDPGRVFHVGGPNLFTMIFKDSDVELVGEEKVGEWDTYVMVSKPRNGEWSTRYWFDKATGVQVKLVETNAAGVAQLAMTAEAIDTSPEFAADRFEMKVPEKFKFIDETEK